MVTPTEVSRFPSHCGDPPSVDYCESVYLPGGYGHGSSTFRDWIRAKKAEDIRAAIAVPIRWALEWLER